MQEEAEVGEEDVAAAEEEGVLGNNVCQDYCFRVMNDSAFFFGTCFVYVTFT